MRSSERASEASGRRSTMSRIRTLTASRKVHYDSSLIAREQRLGLPLTCLLLHFCTSYPSLCTSGVQSSQNSVCTIDTVICAPSRGCHMRPGRLVGRSVPRYILYILYICTYYTYYRHSMYVCTNDPLDIPPALRRDSIDMEGSRRRESGRFVCEF